MLELGQFLCSQDGSNSGLSPAEEDIVQRINIPSAKYNVHENVKLLLYLSLIVETMQQVMGLVCKNDRLQL